jgi:hypothetical protein
MPSRQERRKAERDAAKRAPAQAGAAGAGGAAAARTHVNAKRGGDWTKQAADAGVSFDALGDDVVMRMARQGDREAQWSLGFRLVEEADGDGGLLGAGGRSPVADVGLANST